MRTPNRVRIPETGVSGTYEISAYAGIFPAEVESSSTIEIEKSEATIKMASLSGIPDQMVLFRNYPNPFNPTTSITYGLNENVQVQIDVYNALGQKVRTLVDAKQDAGYHTIQWDGQNRQGVQVASGIYILRMQAADYSRSTGPSSQKTSIPKRLP